MADEVAININIIDDSNYEIEIVDPSQLPELGSTRNTDRWTSILNLQNIPLARVKLSDCSEERLLAWWEYNGRNLGVVYQNMFYYVENTESQNPSKLVFFVKDHKIINNEGAGSTDKGQELQTTLRLNSNWEIKEDRLQLAHTFVSWGLLKQVNNLFIKNPRPDQLPYVISLIQVSSSVKFDEVEFTNAQWEEVTDAFGDGKPLFGLRNVKVSVEMGSSVAKLVSKAGKVEFQHVMFDDAGHFFGLLADYLNEIDGKCGEISFFYDNDNVGQYSREVFELGNKLAWETIMDGNYGYGFKDEDYKILRKDDLVMQRRTQKTKEQRNEAIRQTFKQMLLDENIDVLQEKLEKIEKVDILEKKIENLTTIIEEKDQRIKELERKLSEDCGGV